MADALTLDPNKTALVVIDLQKGITSMPTAPYSADAVIEKAATLADAFRASGGFVVLVHARLRHSRGNAGACLPFTE